MAPLNFQVIELQGGRNCVLNAEKSHSLREGTDGLLIEILVDKSLINYLSYRALEDLYLFPSENTE